MMLQWQIEHEKTYRSMYTRDHFCFQIFVLHNSMCQVPCGSRKSCPVLHFSVVIFSGPSGSLMPTLLSVKNWVPLKAVLGGVRDVALIHFPSCTDSIKPSLQFLYYFVVINASEGSLLFSEFYNSVQSPKC
jgi:hypothetical protein